MALVSAALSKLKLFVVSSDDSMEHEGILDISFSTRRQM
jgi:hypothetical protein